MAEREEAAHELRDLIAQKKAELEKLEELVKYAGAAPVEMRRHQQMAHDVCRQGERLVHHVRTGGIPQLRGEVCAAHAHYGRAAQKLCDRGFDDPHGDYHLGIADVFCDIRAGEKALAGALARVRMLEDRLGCLVGELRGELAALRASSQALAQGENVDAAEEFAARARRQANLRAYGEWGL